MAKQFIASATSDYSALDKQFTEMKTKVNRVAASNMASFQYNECVRLFKIAPQTPPEEVFSIMSRFLNQLEECHHQQWQENEEIEKVKKQTIARSYFAKKSNEGTGSNYMWNFQIAVVRKKKTSSNLSALSSLATSSEKTSAGCGLPSE